MRILPFILAFSLVLTLSAQVLAQETPPANAAAAVAPAPDAAAAVPAEGAAPVAAAPAVPEAPLQIITTPFTESFLFSPAEVAAVRRALSGQVSGTAALNTDQTINVPQRRLISLAGVVYRGQKDWILWLNGRKVTPKEMLPEIVDVQVAKDRVHLKWFDVGLNDVISITLRPHQTYDIVTGVLLPG
jgi:hypothetical protein